MKQRIFVQSTHLVNTHFNKELHVKDVEQCAHVERALPASPVTPATCRFKSHNQYRCISLRWKT